MRNELYGKSKALRQDRIGKWITYACTAVLFILTFVIISFIAVRGLRLFTENHINFFSFITGTEWDAEPKVGEPQIGALALIAGSFGTTLLATLISSPIAIILALYIVIINPKIGEKFIQPVVELLLGIPSVVYGFLGLTLLVPAIRSMVPTATTGFGILPAALVLSLMILPTITSMTIEALYAVPKAELNFAYSLGATRWQMIWHVLLRIAAPSILVAVVYGVARAFGEALAVQMVIGNTVMMPTSLLSPSSTLTTKLTTDIGNTIDGTLPNNALWTLALILLAMSLIFNLIAKFIIGRQKH